jgi:hypothetical protein
MRYNNIILCSCNMCFILCHDVFKFFKLYCIHIENVLDYLNLVETSEALGMHHLQATVTVLLWMWFLNVWDNVPMDLKYICQQYFTCMCFLGFILWYYTFIACWWGKYENLFNQEYHIPWGQRPRGIWCSWVNKFSYFLNLHAINVLLYRMKPRKHIHVINFLFSKN